MPKPEPTDYVTCEICDRNIFADEPVIAVAHLHDGGSLTAVCVSHVFTTSGAHSIYGVDSVTHYLEGYDDFLKAVVATVRKARRRERWAAVFKFLPLALFFALFAFMMVRFY